MPVLYSTGALAPDGRFGFRTLRSIMAMVPAARKRKPARAAAAAAPETLSKTAEPRPAKLVWPAVGSRRKSNAGQGGSRLLVANGEAQSSAEIDGAVIASMPADLELNESAAKQARNGEAGDHYVLQGHVDEANARRITGWVWDPRRPQERIVLE